MISQVGCSLDGILREGKV